MRVVVSCLFLILSASLTFGQAGVTVRGTVTIEPSHDYLTGKVDKPVRPVPGAHVMFRSDEFKEYFAKADEKGKYTIVLPTGRYVAYATVNDKCWMCADFALGNVVLGKKRKVKIDMYLTYKDEG